MVIDWLVNCWWVGSVCGEFVWGTHVCVSVECMACVACIWRMWWCVTPHILHPHHLPHTHHIYMHTNYTPTHTTRHPTLTHPILTHTSLHTRTPHLHHTHSSTHTTHVHHMLTTHTCTHHTYTTSHSHTFTHSHPLTHSPHTCTTHTHHTPLATHPVWTTPTGANRRRKRTSTLRLSWHSPSLTRWLLTLSPCTRYAESSQSLLEVYWPFTKVHVVSRALAWEVQIQWYGPSPISSNPLILTRHSSDLHWGSRKYSTLHKLTVKADTNLSWTYQEQLQTLAISRENTLWWGPSALCW